MNAFVYCAALLCEDCGEAVRKDITDAGHAPADPDNESSYDSDEFPKGPYPDGGGEADSPQHCDHCGEFLENPLTLDGDSYVIEQVAGDGLVQRPGETAAEFGVRAAQEDKGAVAFWIEFYDYLFPTPEEED